MVTIQKFCLCFVLSHWPTSFLNLTRPEVITTSDKIKCTVTLNELQISSGVNIVGSIWDTMYKNM